MAVMRSGYLSIHLFIRRKFELKAATKVNQYLAPARAMDCSAASILTEAEVVVDLARVRDGWVVEGMRSSGGVRLCWRMDRSDRSGRCGLSCW